MIQKFKFDYDFENDGLFLYDSNSNNSSIFDLSVLFCELELFLSNNSNNKYKIENKFRDGLDWSTTTILDPNGKVNSITIEEIFIEKKWDFIDLLKIDIEGAEAEIFKSEVNFLSKTRVIAVEVHDEFISRIEIELILKKSKI